MNINDNILVNIQKKMATQYALEYLLQEFPTDMLNKYVNYSEATQPACGLYGKRIIKIPSSISDNIYVREESEKFMNELTEYILCLPSNRQPRRGDTICFRSVHYRNNDVFFWTGAKVIGIEYCEDEYGHVPNEFLGGEEFPFDHWKNVITHNYICPVRKTYLLQMNIEDTKYFTYPATNESPEKKIAQFLFTLPNKQKIGEFVKCVGYIENENIDKINEFIEKGNYVCHYSEYALELYEMGDECFYEDEDEVEAHFVFAEYCGKMNK
jgi:hypothetical protein